MRWSLSSKTLDDRRRTSCILSRCAFWRRAPYTLCALSEIAFGDRRRRRRVLYVDCSAQSSTCVTLAAAKCSRAAGVSVERKQKNTKTLNRQSRRKPAELKYKPDLIFSTQRILVYAPDNSATSLSGIRWIRLFSFEFSAEWRPG